jgi:hypothetical protein
MVSYKSYHVHIYVYCYVLGKDHPVGRVHLYMAAVFDVANFFTAKKGSPVATRRRCTLPGIAQC